MYAILETGGFQFKVTPNEVLKIPKLEVEPNQKVTFDKVLLVADDKKTWIGQPYVKGASVTAQVIANGKSPKIIVFKFKRRVKYRRKRGHRQQFTEIKINDIKVPKSEKS